MFSGRENPRWEIDRQSAAALLRLQSSLAPSERAAPNPPGLGYRGFKYGNTDESARAYKGFVHTREGVLSDTSFSIERFLLETVPKTFINLKQMIAQELHPE